MACYAYAPASRASNMDCFTFVEKADQWLDGWVSDKVPTLDSTLSWCYVGMIVAHCVMVVFAWGFSSSARFKGYWGVPGTDVLEGWCEKDYAVSFYVAEFHNAYSNLLVVFVGVSSFYLYRRHRLPKRIANLAVCVILVGISGFVLHVSLRKECNLFNKIAQAGLLIAVWRCRGPPRHAAGYQSTAFLTVFHFCTAAVILCLEVEWFAEIHMIVMTCLIGRQIFYSTRDRPRLGLCASRSVLLMLACWLCWLGDRELCWLFENINLNPQLRALSNLLASISLSEVVVVMAVLVAEDMGGEAELGVIGYGPGYQLSSVVGWAGVAYVDSIEYGVKPISYVDEDKIEDKTQ